MNSCVFTVNMSTNLYDDENGSKFLRKAKENPFVPVGEYFCISLKVAFS